MIIIINLTAMLIVARMLLTVHQAIVLVEIVQVVIMQLLQDKTYIVMVIHVRLIMTVVQVLV